MSRARRKAPARLSIRVVTPMMWTRQLHGEESEKQDATTSLCFCLSVCLFFVRVWLVLKKIGHEIIINHPQL